MLSTIRKFLWLAIRSSVAFRLCQLEDEPAPPPPPPRGPMMPA